MIKEDMDLLRGNILRVTKVLIWIVLSGSLLNENSPLSTVQLDAVYFMREMLILYFGYIMLGILFSMGDLLKDRIDYGIKDLKKEEYLFEAQDEVEESVFDYYINKVKDETLNKLEKQSVLDEVEILISKYRKYGLEYFESKSKDEITGVLGRGDPKSTSLVVKEFYRLCSVKVEHLEEQCKQELLEAKHAIDKVYIQARFWDDLYELEYDFLKFKSSLNEFIIAMNSNDLSSSEKFELSAQRIQFLNQYIEMFEDTEKFVELGLYEISNQNHQSEKIAVMETA